MLAFEFHRTQALLSHVNVKSLFPGALLRCGIHRLCFASSPRADLIGHLWDEKHYQYEECINLLDDNKCLERKTANSDNSFRWLKLNWESVECYSSQWGVGSSETPESVMDNSSFEPSPVEAIMIRGRLVYIKCDDQIRLPGSHISGNKARKMLALSLLRDSLFPDCVVSYGGPQSNAMLALAATVHHRNQKTGEQSKKRRFVYYTKKLPSLLRSSPSGNLLRALNLGMEMIELSHSEYRRLCGDDSGGGSDPPSGFDPPIPNSLWVPQGGACEMAAMGTRRLAQEIVDFWMHSGKTKPLSVLVPGGTCSTALFLHHAIQSLLIDQKYRHLEIDTIVVPCVGKDDFAQRQMMKLNSVLQRSVHDIPIILSSSPPVAKCTSNDSFFAFGKPDREVLITWREMRDDHQLLLDLLYGAPSWAILFRHWGAANSLFSERHVMYVHSGGLEGIDSQLQRYKYKNLDY